MPTTTIPPPSSLPTLVRGPTTRTPSTRQSTRAVGRTSPSKNNKRQPPHRTSVPHAQPPHQPASTSSKQVLTNVRSQPVPTRSSLPPTTKRVESIEMTGIISISKKLTPLPTSGKEQQRNHHRPPPTLPSRLRGRVEQNHPANNVAQGGGSSSSVVPRPNQRGGGGAATQQRVSALPGGGGATRTQALPTSEKRHRLQRNNNATTNNTQAFQPRAPAIKPIPLLVKEPTLPSDKAKAVRDAVNACSYITELSTDPSGISTIVYLAGIIPSPSGMYAFVRVRSDSAWDREGTSHTITYLVVRVEPTIEVFADPHTNHFMAYLSVNEWGNSGGWSGAENVHWDPSQPSELVATVNEKRDTKKFDSGPESTWPKNQPTITTLVNQPIATTTLEADAPTSTPLDSELVVDVHISSSSVATTTAIGNPATISTSSGGGEPLATTAAEIVYTNSLPPEYSLW